MARLEAKNLPKLPEPITRMGSRSKYSPFDLLMLACILNYELLRD